MENSEQWATVDLMGHAQTSGRITMENGLLRVDVPVGDSYRTEFYGMAAIYSIKIVSKEIACAYSQASREIVAYDTPIVTREQHEATVRQLQIEQGSLRRQVQELERRLIQVNALPAPTQEEIPF